MSITQEVVPKAVGFFEQMLLIRTLEDKLQALCDIGQAGDLHMCKGQEAIPVGVCAALGPQDLVLTHHRMIGWAVCKGVPLDVLVKELLHGLGGEMHFRSPEYGFMHSFQLVGTVVPVAAGVAWALKNYTRNGGIAIAVFGDAATANGQWHEGVNLAAVQKLPLLLVCENNHLAGNVREEYYQPVANVRKRMLGYGLTSFMVDGNNVSEVYEWAKEAIDLVRREGRPFMLECDTTRLGRHKQGQGDLRSKEEIAKLAERDPLRSATLEERQPIEERVKALIKTVQA